MRYISSWESQAPPFPNVLRQSALFTYVFNLVFARFEFATLVLEDYLGLGMSGTLRMMSGDTGCVRPLVAAAGWSGYREENEIEWLPLRCPPPPPTSNHKV